MFDNNAGHVFADAEAATLATAVAGGDVERVERLAREVNLETRGDRNVTLLQWALLNRNLAALQALLKAGADPAQPGIDGSTAVHMAAMAEDPIYLDTLLAHDADPDTPHGVTGATALSAALMGERALQFQALLVAGADPNRADRIGNTALHVAGKINEPGLALELLNVGADPTVRNAQGVTFQHYLFSIRAELLDEGTKRDRRAVQAWLRTRGIAIEIDGR